MAHTLFPACVPADIAIPVHHTIDVHGIYPLHALVFRVMTNAIAQRGVAQWEILDG